MGQKQCSKCKQLKHTVEFGKDKTRKDGLRVQCKACIAQYTFEHRDEKAAYRAAHRADLAAYDAAYLAEHRVEKAAQRAKFHIEHRADHAARSSAWRKNHREERAIYQKTWQKNNPDKCRARDHRRRARKLAAGGNLTEADIQRQGDCQRWRCWWCGEDCKEINHIDHLVPLAKGGHNRPSNIVISCPTCNLKKHDKMPHEFIERLF